MTELLPTTETDLFITSAMFDDDVNKIVLTAETEDGDFGSMTIYLKGYDEKSKKYVESDEALANAAERFNTIFKSAETETTTGVSFDGREVTADDVTEVAVELVEMFSEDLDSTVKFKGYIDVDNVRFSLWPIAPRPLKVTEDVMAYLSDEENAHVNISSISDNTNYNRFEFIVSLPTGDNDAIENFRISQFVYFEDAVTSKGKAVRKERKLSTKYVSKPMATMIERLKDAKDAKNTAMAEKLQSQIARLAVPERRKLVGNFQSILDLDIEALLEDFEEIPVKISVESIGDNDDSYFLVATLEDN